MGYKEAAIIIVASFLVHIPFTFDIQPYFFSNAHPFSYRTADNVSLGVALLLFPLFGIVADVWLTRYKMIQTSLFILTSILSIALVIFLYYYIIFQVLTNLNPVPNISVAEGICVVFLIAVNGIFEANAVQFGMDQLMEASSSQLSSFIHWYYLIMHLGQQILFFGVIIFGNIVLEAKPAHEGFITSSLNLIENTILIVLGLAWMTGVALAAFIAHNNKKFCILPKQESTLFNKHGRC